MTPELHVISTLPAQPPGRPQAWRARPVASHGAADAAWRNALHAMDPAARAGARLQWLPQAAFELAPTHATLHCVGGVLHWAPARDSLFTGQDIGLADLLPELPQVLRSAALQALLGPPVRAWAACLGLDLLSVQLDGQPLPLPMPAAPVRFRLELSAPGSVLLGAAWCAPGGWRGPPGAATALAGVARAWQMPAVVRTAPLQLPLAAARALRPGDGLDLGPPGAGLRLQLHAGTPARPWAQGHLEGSCMHVESTDIELPAPQPDTPQAPAVSGAETVAPPPHIDSLGLALSVELARLQSSVGELTRLRPGQLLDLGLPLDAARVQLLVGTQRVGAGVIVALEDRLAVEITEWAAAPQAGHAV